MHLQNNIHEGLDRASRANKAICLMMFPEPDGSHFTISLAGVKSPHYKVDPYTQTTLALELTNVRFAKAHPQ